MTPKENPEIIDHHLFSRGSRTTRVMENVTHSLVTGLTRTARYQPRITGHYDSDIRRRSKVVKQFPDMADQMTKFHFHQHSVDIDGTKVARWNVSGKHIYNQMEALLGDEVNKHMHFHKGEWYFTPTGMQAALDALDGVQLGENIYQPRLVTPEDMSAFIDIFRQAGYTKANELEQIHMLRKLLWLTPAGWYSKDRHVNPEETWIYMGINPEGHESYQIIGPDQAIEIPLPAGEGVMTPMRVILEKISD